jgi:acetyl esterase
VHGGGFVGTAVQSDWVNSHLAAQLPAVVVSVEHRLLDPETPLSAAVDDGWEVLLHVLRHAARWGIDPTRPALFGESGGALINALATTRAREADLCLQAQVLVNPAVDVTETMFDHASVTRYATPRPSPCRSCDWSSGSPYHREPTLARSRRCTPTTWAGWPQRSWWSRPTTR